MSDVPMISVVMPNANGARYLCQALDSFLAQDYPAKEMVIVDGLSTDASHDIIRKYTGQYPAVIRWIEEPDLGISDAVNKGIDACRGRFVGYLGNDDVLCQGLFREIATLAAHIPFDVVYFNSYTYHVKTRKCYLQKPATTDITIENLLRHGTIVGLQNMYFQRRLFDIVRFNPKNRYSMDYEILLSLAKNNNPLFIYRDRVATINFFDNNITDQGVKQREEAVGVTLQYLGDYAGPLWCEKMLPPEWQKRRQAMRGGPLKRAARAIAKRIHQAGLNA